MQDIHPISSTARLVVDRRLRPHGHHPNNQQALKCPRCDSLNTKFCYYNNYNLSQPRHYCKNCRRYWTKGGVLRNVPVGGGCRKSKRSSKRKAAQQTQSSSDSSNNNNNCDSRNTITATASAATAMSSSVCGGLVQISDADNSSIRNLDPLVESVHQVGPGELPCFINVMNNHSDSNSDHQHHQDQLSFNGVDDVTGTASFNPFLQSQSTAVGVHDWGFRDEKIGGVLDQTVMIDELLQNRGSSGGLATLDWNYTAENGRQGFLDLPSTVDHQAYWAHSMPTVEHHTHWSDHNSNEHTLFLP